MDETANFVVFGVAGALAVKRIVDMLKRMGLASKYALYAAFVVAAILLTANEAANMNEVFMLWYKKVWNVLFYALVASEVYDAQDILLSIKGSGWEK